MKKSQSPKHQRDLDRQLSEAAYQGQFEQIKTLLAQGADLESLDSDGETPLIRAYSYPEIVAHFISQGANLNVQSKYGDTALIFAAGTGHQEVVKVLLQHGADPNVIGRVRGTALMNASYWGKLACARTLLAHGANIDLQNRRGKTALTIAIREAQIAMAEFLITQGAQYPDGPAAALKAAQYRRDGFACIEAARQGDLAKVRGLLDTGIAPDFVGYEDNRPLLEAIPHKHYKIVTLLLERGASPHPLRKGTESPLGKAVYPLKPRMVTDLLAAGANPNSQDTYGDTPLHRLLGYDSGIGKSHLTVAHTLLDSGADPNLRNKAGLTPLDKVHQELERRAETFEHMAWRIPNNKQELETLAALLKTHGAAEPLAEQQTSFQFLQTLFAPLPLPESLSTLCQLEAELHTQQLSLARHLSLALLDQVYDSGIRPPGCLPFAHVDGSSTHFAFHPLPGGPQDLSQAPIMMYGDEIEPSAQIIAEHFHGFLCLLLSVGQADMLDEVESNPQRVAELKAKEKEDPAFKKATQTVRRLLKQRFRLKKIVTPDAYITQWRTQYPQVEEWDLDAVE